MLLIGLSFVTAAALFVPTAAALATYNPVSNGPSYAVAIPPATASSNAGDIYFQLSAPTSYQWVALGIGKQMSGATIFVMYADGKGNVTISGRQGGQGHVEPQYNSSLEVQLLAGSGISGTSMTANVLCKNCQLLSSTTSTSSPWIAAWLSGSAIDSTSPTADISQHASPNDHRQFTFDLSKASISSDSNPFVSASTGSTTTSSASTPTSGTSSGSGSGSGSESGSGSDSDSGSSTTTSSSVLPDYEKAHGIIMGVTLVLLFPLGAIFMRVVGHAWMHGLLQLFSLVSLLCGFGLGVKLSRITGYRFDKTHTVFGTVIVGLFLVQPFLGVIQHHHYRKHQSRGVFGHSHLWFGRIIIILGIINGGLGLRLAGNTKNGEIAYGVVAGVVAVVYLSAALFKRSGSRREKSSGDGGP